MFGVDCNYKSSPICLTPKFQLESLSWFCIDCPNVGNYLVYKVSTNVHPWGIQMMLWTPILQNASYRNYTLCVRKQGCVFQTFFSLRGWWFLVGVNKDEMCSINKVFAHIP